MPIELACDAYPEGIPDEILDNKVDHRATVEGGRGLRFEPIAGFANADMDRMVFWRPT